MQQSLPILLAQSDGKPTTMVDRDKLSEVSESIRNGVAYDLPWELLVTGIGALLVVIMVVSLRRWWQRRHVDPSPMELFGAIARKAGLTWRDRLLLWRIARACKLPTPIALLLARGSLRHYGDLYLAHRTGSDSRRTGQRLTRIEDTLFG